MANYKAIIRSKDSGSTNSLLKKGLVPGIIYGRGTESTKVAFEDKILKRLMSDGGFYSKILDIDIYNYPIAYKKNSIHNKRLG